MNSNNDRLELMRTPDSTTETPNLHPKQNWLMAMGNWGNAEVAVENAFATAGHPVLWRDGDDTFEELCRTLRRASETRIRDLVSQRAIRGDAQAQNLAFRALFAKAKNEPEPTIQPTPQLVPMTREQASAYIAAGLQAAGIETPDGLSEEVYSEEQWAKWGR